MLFVVDYKPYGIISGLNLGLKLRRWELYSSEEVGPYLSERSADFLKETHVECDDVAGICLLKLTHMPLPFKNDLINDSSTFPRGEFLNSN